MNVIQKNSRVGVIVMTLALLSYINPVSANENQHAKKEPGLTEQASEYVRDYLSDSRRAGSLAGSILGGALLAHPFGPVLGSLIGFMIGKQSMFNEEKTKNQVAQQSLARRDIVPQDGQEQNLPTLSFANPEGVTFSTPSPAKAAMTAPGADTGLPSQQFPIPMALPSGFSRAQIAAMCSGGTALINPRLRSMCFYFQGGVDEFKVAQASPGVALAKQ